ncbi:MAG: hypothetical protein HZB39_03930 [Planctomycetes bacterium]|nr:hypothetical protein [Planctomycetota bacterium]
MTLPFAASLFACLCVCTACAAQDPPQPAAQDANALRQSAFAAERKFEHGVAADAFLALSKLEPTEPDWVVRAGDNLGRAGRIDEAIDLLAATRKRFPDALAIQTMLARTYALKADAMRMTSGRDASVQLYYEDAVRSARAVIAIDAKNLDARLVLASALLELGEAESAFEAATAAVALDNDGYSGNALLGRVAYERFVAARRGASDASGEAKAALEALAASMKTAATDAFLAAAKAEPSRSFPHVALGDLAAWNGDLPGATKLYGDALALDPWAKVNHGWLRSALGGAERAALYGAAATSYTARAEQKANGTATLRWYEAQGLFDQASDAATPSTERTALWKRAAELFAGTLEPLPDYADTGWWLVQSRYWSGDTAGATVAATAFAKQNPRRFADMIRDDGDTIAVLVGLAAKEYEAGHIPASRDLNQVIAFARNTADDWNNWAFLCRETRAHADSLLGYERALAVEPDSPQLLNDCAVILQYHLANPDNLARAREMYERAIELAEKQLATGGLSPAKQQLVATALRDAKNNLAAMGRSR